jgi:hypothetical protein
MKNKKTILIICLLMVLFLGMGFAAGRADLKINGNVKMDDMKWKIHFKPGTIHVKDGSVVATSPAEIVDEKETRIEFEVDLLNLGDFYEFDVDIENAGTIDAVLNSITKTEIPDELKNYVEFEVYYTDETEITKCDELDAGDSVPVHVKLKVKENVNAEDLPTDDAPTHFVIDFNYVQSGECTNP